MPDSVLRHVLRHRVKTSDEDVERFRPLPQNVNFVRQKMSELFVVEQKVGELIGIRVDELLEGLEGDELVEVLVSHLGQDQLPPFPIVRLTKNGGGTAGKVFQKTPLK